MSEIHQMYRKFRKRLLPNNEWFEFIKTQNTEDVRQVIDVSMKAEDRLRNYKNSFNFVTKIRKYCNAYGYTDIYPFEVVKVISQKTVEIRRMKTTPIKTPTQFAVGGFSAVCLDNHSQEYTYESDLDAKPFRIRLGKRGWGNGKFKMEDKPVYFYDYNF